MCIFPLSNYTHYQILYIIKYWTLKAMIKLYKTINFFKYMVIQEILQILLLQDMFKILNFMVLTHLTNLLA